jgi:hypothetical protein
LARLVLILRMAIISQLDDETGLTRTRRIPHYR